VPHGATDNEGLYLPPGSAHYNVQFVSGALLSRATARYFDGLKPEEIESVWIVEARRRVTPEEIKKLCAGKTGA
jgi:hypothetical protein